MFVFLQKRLEVFITMEISNVFWSASLEELKSGYIQESGSFTCLLCGERVEKGIVYPYENRLYEAERYMRIHIESTHQSVFEYLLAMDKKLTGITEHQNKLLSLFYQGKNDKEIQKELGIGSASTIRHHRFALKEKERQAKTFLAMMELLKEKDEYAPAFVPVHKTATMVDERYNITQEEQELFVNKYFSEGVLTKFPNKEKQRLVILREISNHLKTDYNYDEKELNQILKSFYEDYALVRRYLVDYGFLHRKSDGSSYWIKK
jgi:DNA-binding CsgD family transcriptional regulator